MNVTKPAADAQTKALAQRHLARLDRSMATATDQFLSNSKWLTASLLAVNSAGAAAVLSAAKDHGGTFGPGLCFLAGLVMALLGAVAIQEIAGGQIPHLRARDEYWTGVSLGEVRDHAREAELSERQDRAYRFAFMPPTLGWLSGLLFVVGAAWFLVALDRHPAAPAHAVAPAIVKPLTP